MDALAPVTLDSWVTSDSHWSHANIRKYQGRPDNHFDLMRERWFEVVGPEDVVLHLGDLVCYGDQSFHYEHIDGLPGQKLLIKGNHDKHKNAWYEEAGFTVLGRGNMPFYWTYGKKHSQTLVAFSHEPLDTKHPFDINVHGHTHLNKVYTTLGRLEDRINVCVEHTDYRPVRLRDVLP